MRISRSQETAIRHYTGPAIVLAGPGSGKTTVITHRVRHLITAHQVPPESILVITFTRAAALQMKERFTALNGGSAAGVTFGTFHSVFFQILKQAYHYQAKDILREEERFALLMRLAAENRLQAGDRKELAGELSTEISLVKNEQIAPEDFYSGVCSAEIFRKIYGEYCSVLSYNRKIDYDDMLVYTTQLLKERGDIREMWQKRFSFILVDEFQDINLLQFETLRMLSAPEDNVFVVGDDDQAIYRFRGAKPEIMLGFERTYPNAQRYVLEENYRCLPSIAAASLKVVGENQARFEKQFSAVRKEADDKDASAVILQQFPSPMEESLFVVREIRAAVQRGASYQEIAVLTRTGAGGRYLAEKLMQFEIPVQMAGAVPCLYDHWVARDILAYLRLGLGGRDRRDFAQIMNRPVRYISRDVLDTPQVSFDRLRMWYEEKHWMIERLDTMEEQLVRLGRMTPFAAVNYIRFGIGYDEYLEEYAKEHRLPAQELKDVAGEMLDQARTFRTFREWSDHIDEALAGGQQEKGTDARPGGAGSSKEKPADAVRIMTLHGAKGLEFDTVFLPDVNEKNLPCQAAGSRTDIEEERRLFYVGMTRAKNRLYILWTKERYGKEQEPSRFLDALVKDQRTAPYSPFSQPYLHG